jgi:serine/threonine-protein phosphatase PGAM5
MGTKTIYLVRHGQQRAEPPARTRFGNPLTAAGVRQARYTARRLAPCPVSAIFFSTLHRAAETAGIIAQAFPGVRARSSRGLWECIPCVPASRADDFAGLGQRQRDWGVRHAARAFERHFRPARRDSCEVIVCHGNLIRYLACRALGVEPEAWINMGSDNCGVTEIVVRADGATRLVSYNDVGHIPPRWRTKI